MRFLFLDFDGVLNSADWCRRRPCRLEWAAIHGLSPEPSHHNLHWWMMRSIDPDAVERVNKILDATGARVVVSSTWRTMFALTKLQRILNAQGFRHTLLGTTPDRESLPRREDGSRIYRGDEIRWWLSQLDGGIARRDDIVILDDDSDMGEHIDRLVNTDAEHGLTDDDVQRAIALYGCA